MKIRSQTITDKAQTEIDVNPFILIRCVECSGFLVGSECGISPKIMGDWRQIIADYLRESHNRYIGVERGEFFAALFEVFDVVFMLICQSSIV